MSFKLNARPLLGVLALAACFVAPATAGAVSLQEALNAARVNDPAFRAAAAERKAGKLNEVIGRSLLLPSVVANYSEGKAKYDREFLGGTNTTTQTSDVDLKSYSIQLRQPLYSLDAASRYDLGQELAEEADYIYQFNEFDLIQRIATAYIEVLIALEQLNAANAQKLALAESLKLTQKQKAGGESSRLDVLDVTAKHDLAKAQHLEAQHDLESKVKNLEGLTGLVVVNIAGATDEYIPALPENTVYDNLRQQMLAANPEILVARSRIDQAKIQKKRAFAGHTPRVDFVAVKSLSENDTVNTINQITDSEVMQVQMQLPLFSGFGTTAQVDQADEKVRQEKAALDEMVLQKDTELRKAYSQCLLGKQKIEAYKQAVYSANEAVKAARLGQSAGLRVQLDELNALQQLYQTQRDYVRTRYETMTALLKLKLLTGAGGPEEVAGLFSAFDPASRPVEIPRLLDLPLPGGQQNQEELPPLNLPPLN